MHYLGLGLFLGGCLIALVSAAKLAPTGVWPDTLPTYVVSLLVAAIGFGMFRSTENPTKPKPETTTAHPHPLILLKTLLLQMNELSEKLKTLSMSEAAKNVDRLLDDYVLPFTDEEERLLHELGIKRGAEALTAAARGERLLNRAWSAASDENEREVWRSYRAALTAFEQAQQVCESR
ncbi:MAG: hypothetical protein AAF512_04735 [Pseudomonadota bacterium]